MIDPYSVIKMPWITEKTLEARRVSDTEGGYRENNNSIEFIVRRETTKADIKAAVEEILDVSEVVVEFLGAHLLPRHPG